MLGVAIGSLPFEIVRGPLDRYSGDGTADAYTPQIHQKLQIGWIIISLSGFIVASTLVYFFARTVRIVAHRRAELIGEIYNLIELVKRTSTTTWLLLFVVCVVAIGNPLPFLFDPIRYDEAHTYINYASEPLFRTVTRYDAPNNHVFHSVLANLSLRVFGDHLFALRMPALLAQVLWVVLLFAICCRQSNRWMAFSIALLAASFPTVTESAANARGYTVSAALFLCGWLFIELVKVSPRPFWRLFGLAVSVALMLYTVPTMLYGLCILACWIGLSSCCCVRVAQIDCARTVGRALWLRTAIQLYCAMAIGIALAMLLYLPVLLTNPISELRSALSSNHLNRFEMFVSLPQYVLKVLHWWLWDIPTLASSLLIVGAASSLISACLWNGDRLRVWLACLSAIPCCLVLGVWPPERIWLFGLPFLIISSIDGLSLLWDRVCPDWAQSRTVWIAAGVACWITFHTQLYSHIQTTKRHAIVRQSAEIANWLHDPSRSASPILTVTPDSASVIYHFKRNGWSLNPFDPISKISATIGSAWVLTNDDFSQQPIDVLRELDVDELFNADQANFQKRFGETEIWQVPVHSKIGGQ